MERIYKLVVEALASIVGDANAQAATRIDGAKALLGLLGTSILARRCADDLCLRQRSRPDC